MSSVVHLVKLNQGLLSISESMGTIIVFTLWIIGILVKRLLSICSGWCRHWARGYVVFPWAASNFQALVCPTPIFPMKIAGRRGWSVRVAISSALGRGSPATGLSSSPSTGSLAPAHGSHLLQRRRPEWVRQRRRHVRRASRIWERGRYSFSRSVRHRLKTI